MSDYVPTLADVCSAIAEGHLAAASDGATYQVNAFELRRHFNKRRSLPAHALLDNILTVAYSDSREISLLDLCSFGR
ncbi:hypothetical protein [Dictyobacter arantiisoli]|uniref:Uncharacterized protein n=1 Tax=Dictyobacter arantiisoli TaxID=2014874 RepID=A0A5A5TDM1_9CHLR|nr:hypothetical protein [Dictyobacter arantiisoli]GCF09378.1 hypothetical protein KDI_29420 [Dictyobacter arantiisoli]